MHQYPTPPGIDYPGYAAERAARFVGRAWVFATITNWLAADGPRYLVLTGEPGSGKTAIASRLFERACGAPAAEGGLEALAPGFLSAVFFCSASDRRWISPRVFTATLALQLAARYPAFAQALLAQQQNERLQIVAHQTIEQMHGGEAAAIRIDQLNIDALSVEDAFLLTVREPLEALCATDGAPPVVILLDALDEAAGYERDADEMGIISLITRAEHLPRQVRFIITTRPEAIVLDAVRQGPAAECSLSTGTGLEQGLRDMHRYALLRLHEAPALGQRLDPALTLPALAAELEHKSRGNFLYMRYALDMLLRSSGPITLASVSRLPDNLNSVYRSYLQRLSRSPEVWVARYTPILGALAVAQEGLTRDQIAAFTGLAKEQVSAALKRFRQFLVADEALPAAARMYAFYHRSFADFLLDEDRADAYWCDREAAHERIAAHYLSTYANNWEACPEYGRRYLAVHVNAAPQRFLQLETIAALKRLSDLLLLANPRAADALTQTALRIAGRIPREPLALPLARWARGNWEAYYNPAAAIASFEQALDSYQRTGDLLAVGRLASNLMLPLVASKRLDEAHARHDQACAILEAIGDPAAYYLLNLEVNYGLLLLEQGAYAQALETGGRALALALHQGEAIIATEIRVNQAVALLLANDFAASEALLLQARAESLAQHEALTVARIDRNLGELHLRTGRFEQAAALLRQARAAFEALDNPLEAHEVDALLAELVAATTMQHAAPDPAAGPGAAVRRQARLTRRRPARWRRRQRRARPRPAPPR